SMPQGVAGRSYPPVCYTAAGSCTSSASRRREFGAGLPQGIPMRGDLASGKTLPADVSLMRAWLPGGQPMPHVLPHARQHASTPAATTQHTAAIHLLPRTTMNTRNDTNTQTQKYDYILK